MAQEKDTKKRIARFYDNILNVKIRKLINERKIKTDKLAEYLSVSSEAVRLWQAGYARPDIDKIPLICKFFNVSSDYLIGMSEYENQERQQEAQTQIFKLSIKIDDLPPKDWNCIYHIYKTLLDIYDTLLADVGTKDEFLHLMSSLMLDIKKVVTDIYLIQWDGDRNALLVPMFENAKNSSSTINGLYLLFEERIRNMSTQESDSNAKKD